MVNIDKIIKSFPKKRIKLSNEYQLAHNDNYSKNRNNINIDHKLSGFAESWIHKIIAKNNFNKKIILEIGAGNLNHYIYEKNHETYDVVEPWSELLNNSPNIKFINNKYNLMQDIKKKNYYERIISINTFEHLENLVEDIKVIKSLLSKSGVLQVGIPCEGELAFKIGWLFTTGLFFRLRYGLDYGKIMKFEHVNTFEEIYELLKYNFKNVRLVRSRFILPIKNFSFYAYIECSN